MTRNFVTVILGREGGYKRVREEFALDERTLQAKRDWGVGVAQRRSRNEEKIIATRRTSRHRLLERNHWAWKKTLKKKGAPIGKGKDHHVACTNIVRRTDNQTSRAEKASKTFWEEKMTFLFREGSIPGYQNLGKKWEALASILWGCSRLFSGSSAKGKELFWLKDGFRKNLEETSIRCRR